MAGILDTAVSGLNVFKRAMDVTSHNIANVNTEGYSKQRVEVATNIPNFVGGEYVGSGAHVDSIARSYDQFVTGQLRSSTTALGEANTYKEYAGRVDSLLADTSTSLSTSAQSFFDSVSDVANEPASLANRDIMLQEANGLTARFAMLDGQFGAIRQQVNEDIEGMTNSANLYLKSIAELNVEINSAQGSLGGLQKSNDLLDERDQSLKKLSELMDISVISSQDSAMVTVIVKNGVPLVMGDKAGTLSTAISETDSENLLVMLTSANGQTQDIGRQITSGEIAGALRFRDEILDPAQQELGVIAAGIAMEFNAQHKVSTDAGGNLVGGGYDIEGNAGLALFSFQGTTEVSSMALTSNTGTAALTVSYNDINADATGASSADLQANDYMLEYDGIDFSLRNVKDDTSIILQRTVTAGSDILEPAVAGEKLPGIRIEISGAAGNVNADDEFFIRPAYDAARLLTVNITEGKHVAAASNIDPVTGNIVNSALPGDNTNALKLADLANNKGLFGGSMSYQDVYSGLVSEVGGKTRIANVSAASQETLWVNANSARESLSGVNVDEEAANLIKYQQSYQAAAQAISTASNMFNAILGALR